MKRKLNFNPIAFASSALVFFMMLYSNLGYGQSALDMPSYIVGEFSQPSYAGSIDCVNDGDINETYHTTQSACYGDVFIFSLRKGNLHETYDPSTYIYRWKLYEWNQTTFNYTLINTYSLPGDFLYQLTL